MKNVNIPPTVQSLMAAELSLDQAAEQMGITRPTVVAYLTAGHLSGGKVRRGTTQWSRKVDQASVDAYLASNGRDRSAKTIKPGVTPPQARGGDGRCPRGNRPFRRRERAGDLGRCGPRMRAHIVTLEESVARSHAASDLQRQADEARSEEIAHLRDALGAFGASPCPESPGVRGDGGGRRRVHQSGLRLLGPSLGQLTGGVAQSRRLLGRRGTLRRPRGSRPTTKRRLRGPPCRSHRGHPAPCRCRGGYRRSPRGRH